MQAVAVKQRSEIDRIARRLEPRAREAFLGAIATLRQRIDRAALERAIALGSMAGILEALRIEQLRGELAVLEDVVLEGVRQAGIAEARSLQRQIDIAIRFDLTDPRSVEFIRNHGAALVRDVSDETRRGIQTVISRGFQQGLAPPQMARMIRNRIGLTHSQAEIVANYEAALRAAVRGDLSFDALNTRFTLNPVRGAGGLVESRIEAAVRQYEGRMLARRAQVIAHNETMKAAAAGKRELWNQLRDSGALAKDQQREWLTAEDSDVCSICEPLDGVRVGLDEPFPGGFEGTDGHIGCRCDTALVFE